jgi:hypothetical protein
MTRVPRAGPFMRRAAPRAALGLVGRRIRGSRRGRCSAVRGRVASVCGGRTGAEVVTRLSAAVPPCAAVPPGDTARPGAPRASVASSPPVMSRSVPHSPQKRRPGPAARPQAGHTARRGRASGDADGRDRGASEDGRERSGSDDTSEVSSPGPVAGAIRRDPDPGGTLARQPPTRSSDAFAHRAAGRCESPFRARPRRFGGSPHRVSGVGPLSHHGKGPWTAGPKCPSGAVDPGCRAADPYPAALFDRLHLLPPGGNR